jgi:hypothetical protein
MTYEEANSAAVVVRMWISFALVAALPVPVDQRQVMMVWQQQQQSGWW